MAIQGNFNLAKDEFKVKVNGKVENVEIVKTPLVDDVVSEDQALVDARNAYFEAEANIKRVIIDLKEKAELKGLDVKLKGAKNLVEDTEYEDKKQEYIDAKGAYNIAKAKYQEGQYNVG